VPSGNLWDRADQRRPPRKAVGSFGSSGHTAGALGGAAGGGESAGPGPGAYDPRSLDQFRKQRAMGGSFISSVRAAGYSGRQAGRQAGRQSSRRSVMQTIRQSVGSVADLVRTDTQNRDTQKVALTHSAAHSPSQSASPSVRARLSRLTPPELATPVSQSTHTARTGLPSGARLTRSRSRPRRAHDRTQERRDGKRSVFGNIELTPGPGAYNGDVALNPLVKRSFNITLGGLEAL
jgi:hypothetical protein